MHKTDNMRLLQLVFALFPMLVFAQDKDILGLWQVSKVTVGDQVMTPVGKWFRFDEGTYQTGNGWLQNGTGVWTISEGKLSATDSFGPMDEFGAFDISFDQGMQWRRLEDGMEVAVYLQRSEQLPLNPADLVVGLWKAPDGSTLFIRWDRIYVRQSETGRKTGYWHMNGHRPELTMLPHSDDESVSGWKVEVTEEVLVLTSTSDEDDQRTWRRSSGLMEN